MVTEKVRAEIKNKIDWLVQVLAGFLHSGDRWPKWLLSFQETHGNSLWSEGV